MAWRQTPAFVRPTRGDRCRWKPSRLLHKNLSSRDAFPHSLCIAVARIHVLFSLNSGT